MVHCVDVSVVFRQSVVLSTCFQARRVDGRVFLLGSAFICVLGNTGSTTDSVDLVLDESNLLPWKLDSTAPRLCSNFDLLSFLGDTSLAKGLYHLS